ncbi:hypothetical protein, partial [Salmonella enterica]|uniref:hypothetical protein n=1 Tax=Salmonella enterica TaxID=28901 RepID=UPI001C384F53
SYAPVRARLVREPYRRIRKTSGYAGGYLLGLYLGRNSINILEMFSCACHSYHRDHVKSDK